MSIAENDRTRQRVLLLCVVLAVVIGFGVGGAYLVGIAQRSNVDGSGSTSTSAPVTDTATPPAAGDSANSGAATDVSAGVPADPTGDGVRATGPTDSPLVQVSETASASELSVGIQTLLTKHFESINAGDYAIYAATVSNPLSESDFVLAYSTTLDTDGLVHHINSESGSTRITLSFISQQSVELAPPDLPSGCIAWTVVWTIDGSVEDLKVGPSDATQTQKAPCAAQ